MNKKSIYWVTSIFLCMWLEITFAAQSKLNVVFILIDDLGVNDLGYNSYFHETPNIDRLANQSIQFTHSYAASPMCSPTRASLLTGKSPARTGITQYLPGWSSLKFRTITPISEQWMKDDEYTLGKCFKDSGYKTAFMGKWHVGPLKQTSPQEHGFEVTKAVIETNRCSMFFPFRGPKYFPDQKKGDYFTDKLTDEAVSFIQDQKHSDKPFFLYLSHFAMHAPIQAKKELYEKYEKIRKKLNLNVKAIKDKYSHRLENGVQYDPHYAGELENLDENIGKVMKALSESGLEENTVVVFTSDNGGRSAIWRNQGHPTSNAPYRTGKTFLFEGGIRIPLLIKYPGYEARVCDIPVNSIDLYPTLIEMASLNTKQSMDGMSLVPLMKGKGDFQRDFMYWHFPHYQAEGAYPTSAVRYKNYKLIRNYHFENYLLYDLDKDPYESKNIANEKLELVKFLDEHLSNYLANNHAKMPVKNSSKEITEEINHANGINARKFLEKYSERLMKN